MRLDGKTAIVTGGEEGIGKATALLFCKEGARVGVIGRTKSKLDEVVKEAEGPGEIVAYRGDVSDVSIEKDARKMVEAFHKRYGKIDIL